MTAGERARFTYLEDNQLLYGQWPGAVHRYVKGCGDTQHSWFAVHTSPFGPQAVPDAASLERDVAALAANPSAAPTRTASNIFFMADLLCSLRA